MVRVIFVVRAFILFFLLWTFFVAMIVNAYERVAHRCRKKQSIIMVSEIRPAWGIYEAYVHLYYLALQVDSIDCKSGLALLLTSYCRCLSDAQIWSHGSC